MYISILFILFIFMLFIKKPASNQIKANKTLKLYLSIFILIFFVYPTPTPPCQGSGTLGSLCGRVPSVTPSTAPRPTHLLLPRSAAFSSPRALGVPRTRAQPPNLHPLPSAFLPHPQRRHRTTHTALESSTKALYSNPFHVYTLPDRGSAGTRKGGAAPRRAEAPPQPHGHRRQEAEGRSSGQQRGDTGRNQDQGAG